MRGVLLPTGSTASDFLSARHPVSLSGKVACWLKTAWNIQKSLTLSAGCWKQVNVAKEETFQRCSSSDRLGENGGFKPLLVKGKRLHPEGFRFMTIHSRSQERLSQPQGTGLPRFGPLLYGCLGKSYVDTPAIWLTYQRWPGYFHSSMHKRAISPLTTKTWIKGNCNESGRSYTGLWTGEFNPGAQIQLTSEIKHKGLHGSVSKGVFREFFGVRLCACRWSNVCFFFCSHFCLVLRSRPDRCRESERQKESSKAQMNSFCAEARWQIAGVGRWKQEKTTDLLYCTLLQEMDSTPLFYFLPLCFSPPCPLASDASGSGVVECWEDQSSRRPLTRARDTWGRSGEDLEEEWALDEERMSKIAPKNAMRQVYF